MRATEIIRTSLPEGKEADDYNQIGNAEFDSRNTEVDRDQYLHITEDHGKCHQHGA